MVMTGGVRAGMVMEWLWRLLRLGMALRLSATRRDISRVESRSLRSEAGNTGEGDLVLLLPLKPSPGPPTSTTDSESEESSTVWPEILSLSRETVETRSTGVTIPPGTAISSSDSDRAWIAVVWVDESIPVPREETLLARLFFHQGASFQR